MVELESLKIHLAMGDSLFPCLSKNVIIDGKVVKEAKSPLTHHGHKDASCDWEQIVKWYAQYPGCAWGMPTAKRNVLDIDPRNGGDVTLARLIAEHGPLPKTPYVNTGGGGTHFRFQAPPGTRCCKPFEGIDWKAEGGYVIVPPSKIDIPEHEGRAYKFGSVKPWEMEPAFAPGWLLAAIANSSSKSKAKATAPSQASAPDPWVVQASEHDLASHPGSPEGERRLTLCKLVGIHLARGDSPATVKALAEAWAKRCQPAFPEWEKHLGGLLRKEAATSTSATMTSEGREGTNPLALPKVEAPRLVPSPSFLPATSDDGEGESGDEKDESKKDCHPNGSTSPGWPTLKPEAYHGLLGSMLHAITPETEADPAGIMLAWLTIFGNVVGRGAWVQVGPRSHHPALYVALVGRTSDAKGDTWAASSWPFEQVDPKWAEACIANGIGSGEGLVERVADEQTSMGKDGKATVVPGASDKRCLVRLSELSKCFKVGRREGSTLSEFLREAWDGSPYLIPNRRANALSTKDYAISMIGDVTPGAIRKVMEGGAEAFDGTANRYLWACCRSDRDIPGGGDLSVLKPHLPALADALAFAQKAGAVKRDAEADALWGQVYGSLKRSGDQVPHTDRGRPYVVRLAMIFALADKSAIITAAHLRAALAVWNYCRESAALIFGATPSAEVVPDPLWLRLLNAITAKPGINRSGLREIAGHKVKAEAIEDALRGLEAQGYAHKILKAAGQAGGRPSECWYPGKGDGGSDGDDDGEVDDNPSRSSPSPLTPHPSGDAGSKLGEGCNLPSGRKAGEETSGEGTNLPPSPDQGGLVPSPGLLPACSGREGDGDSGEETSGEGSNLGVRQETQVSSLPRFAPRVAASAEGGKGAGRDEKAKEIVIHYPSAQAWVEAVAKAGGMVVIDNEGLQEWWIPEALKPEVRRLLTEDSLHWLPEVKAEDIPDDPDWLMKWVDRIGEE